MNLQRHKRIIISGGGTGGHIFPAISIANALRRLEPGVQILFVGAEGRMEMEKVPAAGYEIKGLPVAGFYRSLTPKNFIVLFRLLKSLLKARKIIKEFAPDIVVGVGGYASGPVLKQAGRMGIPTLIQEQNSYAGVTNKLLAKKAAVICVAYDRMERYFPPEKIIKTGNPVRMTFDDISSMKEEGLSYFGLKNSMPAILVLGGSLGAGTINKSLSEKLHTLQQSGCQWIWQTGKNYFSGIREMTDKDSSEAIKVYDFINRMDYAFAAADIIISRAGAGTISELCLVGKPVILVPSPNVAEDHQTRNAMALADKGAAVVVKDADAQEMLVNEALSLVKNIKKKEELSDNIRKLADRDSDIRIAQEVLKLADR